MFHLYGFFIGIAVVTGYSVAVKLEAKVRDVAGYVIGTGLIGARIYHVMDMWSYYAHDLAQVLAVWNGGMSIWGGIIGGGVGLLIANLKLANSQIENEKILGAIVVALPLAQTIGRIANGVNGEFTNLVWILPWWGAEALLDLVLFGVLGYLRLKGVSAIRMAIIYMVFYGMIRYLLQPYR